MRTDSQTHSKESANSPFVSLTRGSTRCKPVPFIWHASNISSYTFFPAAVVYTGEGSDLLCLWQSWFKFNFPASLFFFFWRSIPQANSYRRWSFCVFVFVTWRGLFKTKTCAKGCRIDIMRKFLEVMKEIPNSFTPRVSDQTIFLGRSQPWRHPQVDFQADRGASYRHHHCPPCHDWQQSPAHDRVSGSTIWSPLQRAARYLASSLWRCKDVERLCPFICHWIKPLKWRMYVFHQLLC